MANLNALLNWGGKYSQISTDYVNITSDKDNYKKLLFTNVDSDNGDNGHIITHGIDYTPTYNGSLRGFVPTYALDEDYSKSWDTEKSQANALLFGDAKWRYIRAVDLPMVAVNKIDTANIYNDENLFSAASVIKLLQELRQETSDKIKANDAMTFIGGVSKTGDNLVFKVGLGDDGDSYNTLNSGDTFRASANFVLGSGVDTVPVESGDILVFCGPDETALNSEAANAAGNWVVVEGNVKGNSTYTINGTSYEVASDYPSQTYTIYAPDNAGTKGGLLYSTGSTPEWTGVGNPNQILVGNSEGAPTWLNKIALEAGFLYKTKADGSIDDSAHYDAKTLFSDFAKVLDTNTNAVNNLKATVGDTTILLTSFDGELWNIKAVDAVTADKTDHALTVNSNGLTLNQTKFDGSADTIISLNIAKSATGADGEDVPSLLGGVVIDGGVVAQNTGETGEFKGKGGIGATLSITDQGVVYLTESNIINALGYEPSDLSDFIIANNKANGLVPQLQKTQQNLVSGYYVLAFNPEDSNWNSVDENQVVTPMWRQLPSNLYNQENIFDIYVNDKTIADNKVVSYDPLVEANPLTELIFKAKATDTENGEKANRISITKNGNAIEFESTWRPIQVNGSDIADGTLNIVSSSDILVATSSVEDGNNTSDEIGFCIAWYNIETTEQEYVVPSKLQSAPLL